ncbi:F0F1 ATP synthase subunit A [Nonomuraea harbinensis]|uniref:ATP synthase subunit a n=1 Tax=Nonomuraea harbinensis TaxID=1286938 RepID=A0ABW1BVE8_9ACTN|nr:F0F1 ATP synthase subunit A [Nonomuraea harbinensis]
MAAAPDFRAPSPDDLFEFPALWQGWVTKPVLLAVLGALAVCAFAWAAYSRPKLVPRGVQNVGEYVYLFVRDQIARPFLGRAADRWMPLLLSLFLLILVWNLLAVVPLLQFPVTARASFPWVLAIAVYLVKLYVAFTRHGVFRYLKGMMFPPGLPRALAIVLYAPLELVYFFVTAPFTHAVRLLANMFAGHTLLAFFSAVGFWFLIERPTLPGFAVGVLGVAMTIVLTAFEIFIQFLQAYLFTMLAAMYVGSSLRPEH